MRLSHVEAFPMARQLLEGTLLPPSTLAPQLMRGLQCRAGIFPMNAFWPNPDALQGGR